MVDRYIEVRTQIPERLLARYHELVAKLLREEPTLGESSEISERGRTGSPVPWTEPEIKRKTMVYPGQDGGEDVIVTTPSLESVPSASYDAFNLYLQLSPRALETLQYLVSRPGQRVSGDDLARDIGVPSSELTGSLASIRKRCVAANRPMPFRYRSGPNGGTYWMDTEVADVFQKAYGDLKLGGPDEEGAEVFSELIVNTWTLLQLFAERQGMRMMLRTSQRHGLDEALQLKGQQRLDAAEEQIGQLSKRRAALLRKYDPQSLEEFGLEERLSEKQTPSASRQEASMVPD